MKPRVLTPEEIRALPRLAIVFIELFDGEEGTPDPVLMAGMKTVDGNIVDEDGSIFCDFEDDTKPGAAFDGSWWRFWNGMPTEEDRKAVPWDYDVRDK